MHDVIRRLVAAVCLVLALSVAGIFGLAVYVIWAEGTCPSNQCDDDRVLVLMSAVIVPAACTISYLAIRTLRRGASAGGDG